MELKETTIVREQDGGNPELWRAGKWFQNHKVNADMSRETVDEHQSGREWMVVSPYAPAMVRLNEDS